jgi:nitrate/nitrite transporter NarK
VVELVSVSAVVVMLVVITTSDVNIEVAVAVLVLVLALELVVTVVVSNDDEEEDAAEFWTSTCVLSCCARHAAVNCVSKYESEKQTESHSPLSNWRLFFPPLFAT